MSPRRGFDRYMVQIGTGTNPKLAALTDSEFRAHIVGVLAIAAGASFRGCLLVGDVRAEAKHIARTAGVTERAAKSAVTKLCSIGVLYEDPELGCLRVHDWADINPEPRSDPTAAERQRRYRQNLKAKGLDRKIPAAVRAAVSERDEGSCVSCGGTAHLEYHHRTPIVSGGDHSVENLELRCQNCHRGHAGHGVTGRNAA